MRLGIIIGAGTTVLVCGCSQGYVHFQTENTYQTYSGQQCKIDETALLTRLSKSVGPFQSRVEIEKAATGFLKKNSHMWENVDSDCFLEAVVNRGVPVYGKEPVSMSAYYEFWVFANSHSGVNQVCVGVNAISPKTEHFTDRAHKKKILYPRGYKGGFAKQKRYLPICKMRNEGYGYLHN